MRFAFKQGPWLAYLTNGDLRVPLRYATHVITADGEHKRIHWTEDRLRALLTNDLARKPVGLRKGWVVKIEDNPDVPGGGLLG